ncbi:C-terminal binding protein [Galactobacter sp.]|uniref:C-terminal binding protein n=1 Tax=Galactobacter sp. TaxID=2676125 RepID=UPI0025BF88A2|nr:C-terminal binding protein [Galactobacter sp.]
MTKPRPKVLITDHTWPDTGVERGILAELDADVVEAPAADEESLIEAARGADAIITCFANVSERVIEAAGTGLRVIARYGTGVDNIDVGAATARGIPVTYVPVYCVDEVAEHALALIFALERGVTSYDRASRGGGSALDTGLGTRRISGRTLGLIGGGRIGRAVEQRATALGMSVLMHHPSGRDGSVPLPRLLAEADYVSLHLPLTDGTRHLVNHEFLAAMRPGSFLINTARGPIVDTAALAQALNDGPIAGAGLDMVDDAESAAGHAVLEHPRTIVTPHVAFYSDESIASLADQAARSVVDVLTGREPANTVS